MTLVQTLAIIGGVVYYVGLVVLWHYVGYHADEKYDDGVR